MSLTCSVSLAIATRAFITPMPHVKYPSEAHARLLVTHSQWVSRLHTGVRRQRQIFGVGGEAMLAYKGGQNTTSVKKHLTLVKIASNVGYKTPLKQAQSVPRGAGVVRVRHEPEMATVARQGLGALIRGLDIL